MSRAAAAVALAAGAALLAGCSAGDGQSAQDVRAADRATLVGNAPTKLAVGGGSVWVISEQEKSLRRVSVSPPRAVGAPLGLAGTPVDVSASARGVYVVNSEPPVLTVLDAGSGRITARTQLPGTPVAVDVAGRDVWIALKDPNRLVRADARTGALTKTSFALPFEPSFVSARDFALWVGSSKAKRVARIDQTTGRARRSFRVPNALEGMAAGDGGTLWFAQGDKYPYGHVPVEGDYVELDDPGATDGSFRIAVGPRGAVFVVGDHDSGTTTSGGSDSRTYYFRQGLRVDPRTGDLLSRFELSDEVRDIAAGDGAVWSLEPATGNVPPGSWRVSRHRLG